MQDHGGDHGFVGRRLLVAELRRLRDRVAGGNGALLVVSGESGVGKTSLVEHALGDAVLWGRCRQTGAPALWPWTQVARAARRAGIVGLDALGGVAAASGASPSGHERFARFDEMTEALTDRARRAPITIALDDVQWADEDSVELLGFVAAEAARGALLVAVTLRRGEPHSAPRLSELLASTDVVTVELGGLDGDDLGTLLATVLGGPPPDGLVDEVALHTGGNPLFVRETARLLRANGTASRPESWRGALPEGVGAVLSRRLARLPQPVDRAVRAAAIVGMEVDPTIVAALLDADRTVVADLLDTAADAGVLLAQRDGRMRFQHALVREAALAGLPATERRSVHARAAAVLTALAGDRAAAEIAEHHVRSGDTAAARRWAIAAAERAERSAMYADAAAWFERCLGWPSSDERDRLTVLAAFARAVARAGRHGDAAAAYAELAAGARSLGDAELFARAALGVGTVGGSFEVRLLDPDQVAMLEEALARMAPGDSSLRSWLAARLSVAASLVHDVPRRRALADEAVAMARRLGDDAALAHALGAFCDSRAGPADQPLRLVAADELLAAARRAGDAELELLGRRLAIVALLEIGDVAAAERHIGAAVTLAERLRQPQLRWFTRTMQGMLELLHGDLDGAGRFAELARADGRAAGSAAVEMVVDAGLLAVVLREQGEAQRAADLFRSVAMRHGEAGRGVDPVPAFVIEQLPDPDGVRRMLAAVAPGELVGADESIFLLVTGYELLCAAFVGEVQRARAAAARLTPFSRMFILDGFASVCYGPAATWLGMAAAMLGEVDEARRWFDEALTALVPLPAPRLVHDVRDRLARLGEPAGRVAAPAVTANELVRDGEVWQVAFAGRRATFTDAKGLRDLAVLLGRPAREVHALELMGSTASAGAPVAAVDAAARRAYEQRVRDLTEDIEEAEAHHDLARAERLDDERGAVLHELAAALGLGGRDRPAAGDPGERARKAVGMRIRSAIERIDRELPDLGRHLRHSVRTGLWCAYEPEQPTPWDVAE